MQDLKHECKENGKEKYLKCDVTVDRRRFVEITENSNKEVLNCVHENRLVCKIIRK